MTRRTRWLGLLLLLVVHSNVSNTSHHIRHPPFKVAIIVIRVGMHVTMAVWDKALWPDPKDGRAES